MLEKETIQKQIDELILQRDTAAQTFHQAVGALAILEEMLKMQDKHEAETPVQLQSVKKKGEKSHG